MYRSPIKIKPLCFVLWAVVFSSFQLSAQQTVVKVDFNMSGRKTAEVNAFGYTPWEVVNGGPDTLRREGIDFIVSAAGDQKLNASWFKAGVRGEARAKFSDDGIMVRQARGGKSGQPEEIRLRIRGLTPGKHTLITYHNLTDQLNESDPCPLDIYVDDKKVISGLHPTIRASRVEDCAVAVFGLNVTSGKDIVVRFVADGSGNASYHKIILNGFQLDGINPALQSRSPLPANRDEHIQISKDGNSLLKWQAAQGALSHEIYFGTDSAQVATAGTNSPCFKGSAAAADTSFTLTKLNSLDTYYWRVDEVFGNKTIKGLVWEFRLRQLAFPDAEGYGRFARGGRGGKVVAVTNLNDDGPGSLRAAVMDSSGPRVIIFNVGGVIELKSRLVLSTPYVTVAGQTAPGKGICIRSAPFGVTGNDDMVRFVRVRVGDGPTYDGMGLTGADHSIIDHCSISWTKDESFSSRGAHNITLQRTLISEALNAAGHKNYPKGKEHGFAATIGGDIGSFHHNLLADCYGRNWSLGGGLVDGHYGGRMDIRNNVVYNWGHRATDGGAHEVNFVGNYYKPGPGTDFFYAFNAQHEGVGLGMQRCFFAGNIMPGYFDLSSQQAGRKISHSHGDTSSYATYVDQPFFPSYVTTQTAEDAYKDVLSDVGCNAGGLDEHDQRIISETLKGVTSVTGSYTHKKGFPDKVADAGGYEDYPTTHRSDNWDTDQDGLPDWWETARGLNPHSAKNDSSESNADPDGDGFTNLDDYLDWMAHAHYSSAQGGPVYIDLKKLAVGYQKAPQFTVTHILNGRVKIERDGQLIFTPDINKGQDTKLGGFDFTVKDARGSSMTRKVNIAIGVDIDQ